MIQIDIDLIRKLLRYEPETGKLYWLIRSPDTFDDGLCSREHKCAMWNAKFAEKETFNFPNRGHYLQGTLLNKTYKTHRVIWAIYHGAWPIGPLDHINGVRDDNRIGNLREVTQAENNRNMRMPSCNTSGYIGIHLHETGRYWRARISVRGNQKHLGYFPSFEDAFAARKAAEAEYGYHPNHGRTT